MTLLALSATLHALPHHRLCVTEVISKLACDVPMTCEPPRSQFDMLVFHLLSKDTAESTAPADQDSRLDAYTAERTYVSARK